MSTRGGDEAHGPGRRRRPEPHAQGALGGFGQRHAAVVVAPPQHCRPRVDVLGHGVLQEVLRGEDGHLGVGIDHAEHTSEVVDVGMGVDDRRDGPVAAVGAVQGEGGRCRLLRDQRIDDDDAVVALDEGHVRQVEATDLVDALGDLVQAVAAVELALSPEARVRSVGARVGEEGPPVHVPDLAPLGVADRHGLDARDETPVCVLEIRPVVEVGWHGGALLWSGEVRARLRVIHHEPVVGTRGLRPWSTVTPQAFA